MVMMSDSGAGARRWLKSGVLTAAVGALVLSGSGTAHADRGQASSGSGSTTTHPAPGSSSPKGHNSSP